MAEISTNEIVRRAMEKRTVVPAFNIPYLPMMEPVVRALKDSGSFGLVVVARLEIVKFESKSLKAVADEFARVGDSVHTRLHLDHLPVIDEDGKTIDYVSEIKEAIDLGYKSVMVDGSRLPLEENIEATRKVCEMAHGADVPVEGELGAVLGHEEGPQPDYEELFASGRGFTDPAEAKRFVEESGVDWLSVAIGNIHGAISPALKNNKKPEARLSIERLSEIGAATGTPLVLHGGTGIRKEYVMDAIRHGIAKVNVATAIRQPYEVALAESQAKACQAVYDATLNVIEEDLEIAGTASLLGLDKVFV